MLDAHSVFDPEEASSPDSATAAPHPEEMKGTVHLNIGKWVSVTATGRATPAGFICAALLACSLLIPLAVGARRRR
jgi:hypothetical protein